MENVTMYWGRGESSSGLWAVDKPSHPPKSSLYMMIDDKICRMRIRNRTILSEIQFLDDFPVKEGDKSLLGSRLLVLNSNLHVLGGRWSSDSTRMNDTDWDNTNVFRCEPKKESICCYPSTLNFSGPKIDSIVVNLEGKTYVLSTKHYSIVNERKPYLFEVLENGIWKTLPNPPFPYVDDRSSNRLIYEFCSWSHFLLVHLWRCQSFYLFDTHKEEWMCVNDVVGFNRPSDSGFAKFGDHHLIGMPFGREILYVYKVDNTGLPTFDSILCFLTNIFDEPLETIHYPCFILPMDDSGLMCIVYSGFNRSGRWVRVAIIQVRLRHLDFEQYLFAEHVTQRSYRLLDENSAKIQSAVVM